MQTYAYASPRQDAFLHERHLGLSETPEWNGDLWDVCNAPPVHYVRNGQKGATLKEFQDKGGEIDFTVGKVSVNCKNEI